jgi:hypothetical protein
VISAASGTPRLHGNASCSVAPCGNKSQIRKSFSKPMKAMDEMTR